MGLLDMNQTANFALKEISLRDGGLLLETSSPALRPLPADTKRREEQI